MSVEIELGGRKIEAELADSLLSRAWGMSLRSEGKMLFVFPTTGKPAIDMMLLSIPLQLIFLDAEKQVVDVHEAEPWTKDPRTWKLYRPSKPAKYLLESAEFLDIEEGERLEFET